MSLRFLNKEYAFCNSSTKTHNNISYLSRVISYSPFHNWRTSTLRSEFVGFVQATAYVSRALAFVACVFVVALSLLKIKDMHTTSIQTRSNANKIIVFKYRKINLSCLCVCVLCDHETVAQHVSCNLATFYYHCKIYRFQFPCVATSIYWIQGYTFASSDGFAASWIRPSNIVVKER